MYLPVVPKVVLIGGPNGAGKSTIAPMLLRDLLGVPEFVNADVIATGLSAFAPDNAALRAGRLMLERLHALAKTRADFAFETTLASRSFAPWIRSLREQGYEFHLIFVWIESADMAVARVRERSRAGGHHVPEAVVRRRYLRGLANFFRVYARMATCWYFYDNSWAAGPRLVAHGNGASEHALDPIAWEQIKGSL